MGLRTILPSMLLLLHIGADAQTHYTALDGNAPIAYHNGVVTFEGQQYVLDSHTFFVDGHLKSDEIISSPYVYNDFKEAMRHIKNGTDSIPMTILLAPWVYWVDDPNNPVVAKGKDGREPFGMVLKCESLHFIGLSSDARNVVLASQRGQTQGAEGNFTMFDITGNGFRAENLTMGNFCNVDLDFPLKPELSRKKREAAIVQAHVGYLHGDKAVCRNVRFISRLNLNPMNGARRILYDHCHFECTDDALTGNGVYNQCTIHLYGQKPFYTTHRSGAVFLNSEFTMKSHNSAMSFTKASGTLTLIDCDYIAEDTTYVGWTNYPDRWLRCYQSGFRLNGKPYTIGTRHPENTVDIADKPIRHSFNIYNLLRGNDDWDPMSLKSTIKADSIELLPTSLVVNKRKITVQTGHNTETLTATLLMHGGIEYKPDSAQLSSPYNAIRWRVEKGFERYVSLSTKQGGTVDIKSVSHYDHPVTFTVTAYTPSGLEAAVEVTAKPSVLPAPEFTKEPSLRIHNGIVTVDYALNLGHRIDESAITWYRCDNLDGIGAIPVAVSRGKNPQHHYRLTDADNGWYLFVTVEPKHLRSDYGEPLTAITGTKIKGIRRFGAIETDFREFPTTYQPQVIPGFWTVDGYKPKDTKYYDWSFDLEKDMWVYGTGFNGAVGEGLLQAQRGARLMWTPKTPNSSKNQTVTLLVDPTKTAGQGFGSATGQYMDVCIKFDTESLTGYALRIERTPKNSKAVDFSLIEYKNGETKAISEAVTSDCYRTGCTIVVAANGSKLTAHVETSTPLTDSGLPHVVDLEATIKPNDFGGVAIQHTGSCGESTTMLHKIIIQ